MASLQPPEPPPANGGVSVSAAPAETPPAPATGSKRQRRPSVRLGDIGDQPAAAVSSDVQLRRIKTRPAHLHPHPPSKTRHLTTLAAAAHNSAGFYDSSQHEDGSLVPADENLDPLTAGIRRAAAPPVREGTPWRGIRRVRSGWASSKLDEGIEGGELKSSGGEDDGYNGFQEDSESPSDRNDRRGQSATRVRVLEGREAGPASEEDLPSDTDRGDWNDQNGRSRSAEDDGVRSWLHNLGLGRYAPVFEIHEVDDEVLPFLTLEDLKDMGINAVGSRRKIFCAIKKLRKNMT